MRLARLRDQFSGQVSRPTFNYVMGVYACPPLAGQRAAVLTGIIVKMIAVLRLGQHVKARLVCPPRHDRKPTTSHASKGSCCHHFLLTLLVPFHTKYLGV